MPSSRACVWKSWETLVTSVLPLVLVLVVVRGVSNCEEDCKLCPQLEQLQCEWGAVNNTGPCFCGCPACRVGPGENCGGPLFLKCAVGSYCDPLEYHPYSPRGVCSNITATVTSNPTATLSPSPSPLPSPSRSSASPSSSQPFTIGLIPSFMGSIPTPTPTPATPLSTEEPTQPTFIPTTNSMTGCRHKCSVEFCSSEESGKTRTCSAQDSANVRAEGRGNCQHTSCKSCYLLVEPSCNIECVDPPDKKCLRRYYECITNHYFHSTASSVLLPLEHPEARTRSGRVVCHVPPISNSD